MICDWSPLVLGLEVFGRGLGLFDGHHNEFRPAVTYATFVTS